MEIEVIRMERGVDYCEVVYSKDEIAEVLEGLEEFDGD